MFAMQQQIEVKEEGERNLREMIKVEQDEAYQQSLAIDRYYMNKITKHLIFISKLWANQWLSVLFFPLKCTVCTISISKSVQYFHTYHDSDGIFCLKGYLIWNIFCF